jgi:DNA mismatch repair ATPase MutS
MTVMKSDDDLGRGRSLYLDEAASVLRVVQAAAALPPALCLLDEPYRGTNSSERIAGGVAVVRFLVGCGACTVLATHDAETVTLLGEEVENGHFEDRLGPRGLEFDHRFVAGPAVRTNAIDLLEHLGYPASLVAVARDCAAALRSRRG